MKYITADELKKFVKSLDKGYSVQFAPIIDEYNEFLGYQLTLVDDKGNILDKILEAKQKYIDEFKHEPNVLIMNKNIEALILNTLKDFKGEKLKKFYGTPVIITPIGIVAYY